MDPDEPIRSRIREEIDFTFRAIREGPSSGYWMEGFLGENLIAPRAVDLVHGSREQESVRTAWAVTNPTTEHGGLFIAYDPEVDKFCLAMELMERPVPPNQVMRLADLKKPKRPTGVFVYISTYGSLFDTLRGI